MNSGDTILNSALIFWGISDLPPVRMTSHLYRGNSRLVSIGEGLFLDEITTEGAIMSFRGQRFRVRAD